MKNVASNLFAIHKQILFDQLQMWFLNKKSDQFSRPINRAEAIHNKRSEFQQGHLISGS